MFNSRQRRHPDPEPTDELWRDHKKVERRSAVSFSQRLQEIRVGFGRPFWVANITELFERLAYYGASAVLSTVSRD